MFRKRQIIGTMYIMMTVIVAGIIAACTPCVVREAQTVVAEADSLRAEGQMYDDSVQLAEACATLGRWQWFYAVDYAHACYHYGRLLRKKGDPVTAMQVLIRATHSRTHDYHILGRVYSNMGDICYRANEFQLAYDMYEQSANKYLHNGDSLLYYYGLNNMAYELAEQGKKAETLSLIKTINSNCFDPEVYALTCIAKSILYTKTKQYDSVLIAVDECTRAYPSSYAFKARALWHLSQRDSALYYARKTLTLPNVSQQEQYNMLYIVLNEDSTLLPEEIKALSGQRADIEQKMLVPLHKRNAVAVNLLKQDIHRKPIYVYAVPLVLVMILVICLCVWYARKIYKSTIKQEEILQTVQNEQLVHFQYKQQTVDQACQAIRNMQHWQTEINWKSYAHLCEFMDKNFFFFAQKLKELKVLNEKEIRLCILVLIGGFTDKQMADILCYGENSIRGIKRYAALKLGTNSANLRKFLLDLAIGVPL